MANDKLTRATFVASDPYHRSGSENKLKDLISDLHGVKDWTAGENGEITIVYDHEETSSNVIEESLAGMGYHIKHVRDDARLGKADRPNYGVSEEKGGKPSYGN